MQIKRSLLPILLIALMLPGCVEEKSESSDISPNNVVPSKQQFDYQQLEFIGFIHFTVNTFTDKEWGFGDEGETIFAPSALDVEQWVRTAKAGGMKQLILTAKHHDGFCLWPSKLTEHNIKNSPYKNGTGDIVREFVDACAKHGLKAGLYLSPWDRNHKDYGTPAYIEYYRNQLTEILTQYGEINEIWFDGANGGDGYYGGANESRKIDRETYYDWDSTFALVKSLQPDIKIFSDAGPDVHWIGNEHGIAGETFWSTITSDSLIVGTSKTQYLNSGDPQGTDWIVGQCDVSIRPGWFYHAAEDERVKTPNELLDIYYKSVGRNAMLLVNIPPDRRGIIHENDVAALTEFKQILDETFDENLALAGSATASNTRLKHNKFNPDNVLDTDLQTYWATDDKINSGELILKLPRIAEFDRISIQEPIQFGQRISAFALDVMIDGRWETVFNGTTIGYKRLIRTKPMSSDQIRLRIIKANNTIAIANFGLYKSSPKELPVE
ncbi:MAG: alpha-L-fucosidase [Cyclobacteriaceae bacterium]